MHLGKHQTTSERRELLFSSSPYSWLSLARVAPAWRFSGLSLAYPPFNNGLEETVYQKSRGVASNSIRSYCLLMSSPSVVPWLYHIYNIILRTFVWVRWHHGFRGWTIISIGGHSGLNNGHEEQSNNTALAYALDIELSHSDTENWTRSPPAVRNSQRIRPSSFVQTHQTLPSHISKSSYKWNIGEDILKSLFTTKPTRSTTFKDHFLLTFALRGLEGKISRYIGQRRRPTMSSSDNMTEPSTIPPINPHHRHDHLSFETLLKLCRSPSKPWFTTLGQHLYIFIHTPFRHRL